MGRRRTVGSLLALGLVMGACSTDAGDDIALAFNDSDVVNTTDDAATTIETELLADGFDASDFPELANGPVAEGSDAPALLDAVTAPPLVIPDRPEAELQAEPVVEDVAGEEPASEDSASVVAVGQDSALVGTTGASTGELMRNLALSLGGTSEILGDPERTENGGTFSFTLTSAGVLSQVDVTFVDILDVDNPDLIVGHEATGVVVTP